MLTRTQADTQAAGQADAAADETDDLTELDGTLAVPATMRAAVLVEGASHLAIEEIPTPTPGKGEVLVRVAACGLCHSDIHVIRGQIPFPRPCVIGHEIAGTVVRHGPDVDVSTVPAPGTRVACGFVMPCGTCVECGRGRDDLCLKFFGINRTIGALYDGTSRLQRADGEPLHMFSMSGMAQYAVVPATDVFALPDGVPLVESAVVGCAAFTAYGAVKHGAEVRPGSTVAVVGVGGVGLNIVQIARAFGARTVIAVDIAEDKLVTATSAGATHVVDASTTDPVAAVREITGLGVDVAFEALGVPATFRQAIDMVRTAGRMVPVGLGRGEALVPITPVVRNQITIRGSYGARTRQDMPELLTLVADGVIRPTEMVTRRVPLAQVNEAVDALEAGTVVGRSVIVMD